MEQWWNNIDTERVSIRPTDYHSAFCTTNTTTKRLGLNPRLSDYNLPPDSLCHSTDHYTYVTYQNYIYENRNVYLSNNTIIYVSPYHGQS